MEPFVRQAALELLLNNYQQLKPEELTEALQLGLKDPDENINELAWNFVNQHQKVKQFAAELGALSLRLKKGDEYWQQLAKLIQKKLAA